jgi:hypothetical protein
MAQIDDGLALSLAGQVSVGLTPGEGQPERMLGALTSIGLMLANATDAKAVLDQLALIDQAKVVEHGHGVTRIEWVPPGPGE